MFDRKYIFNPGPFSSQLWLDYRSVKKARVVERQNKVSMGLFFLHHDPIEQLYC